MIWEVRTYNDPEVIAVLTAEDYDISIDSELIPEEEESILDAFTPWYDPLKTQAEITYDLNNNTPYLWAELP